VPGAALVIPQAYSVPGAPPVWRAERIFAVQ
jgi:hypothetical protein